MKSRSKFILVSVAVAIALALTGGLLLKSVQAGGWAGPSPMHMSPHGMGTHVKGGAWFTPPRLPKFVERDLRSNCDRLFYKLKGGRYEQIYLRCKYGNSTHDYSPDYRRLFYFYSTLQMTATVGTDPDVCATEGSVVVADGTTVYYCYTATNTGNIALPLHNLEDSEVGTVFSAEPYLLAPGASVSNVDLGYEISHTFTAPQAAPLMRAGTWTGYVSGGVSASASATAVVDVAAVDMVKTVSETADVCGETNVITPTVTPVLPYYCYTVNNIGSITLPVHSLVDSNLGDILSGYAYELGPGQSTYTITAATEELTVTTTNVATWTASVDTVTVTDTATATVNIE